MPYGNNSGYGNRGGFNNPQYNNGGNKGGNFPKYSGNSKNNDGTNSNGIRLSNEKIGKFLTVSYWNTNVKLSIGTLQPGVPVQEASKNAQTFDHTISFNSAFDLYEVCEDVENALKNSQPFIPIGIFAGMKKDAIIEISDGSNINMPTGLYLVIYKSPDAAKRTRVYDMYQFDTTVVLKNYNHDTGEAELETKTLGDFKKFKMALKEAAKAFTNAQAHIIKHINKSESKKGLALLEAIGKSMNIDISKSVMEATGVRSNGKSSYNKNNYNNNYQGSNGYNRAQQAISNEPVDVNMSSATLQQVDISQFMN